MRSRIHRVVVAVGLAALGAYLTAGSGCISFLGETALSVVDVCFILDCTDAAGGVAEFCDPRIFVDCP